jgi:hypothetical protein
MARTNLPHPEEARQRRLAVRDAALRRLLTVRGRRMAAPGHVASAVAIDLSEFDRTGPIHDEIR